jgi:signal transduction histidine kinase
MRAIALLLISLIACPVSLRAQEEEPRTVTIPEATQLVGRHERVKVIGVLLYETGPGRIYLWTETGKIRAQLTKPVAMKPGDRLAITALPVPYLQPGQLVRPADEPMVAWLADAEAVNLGPGAFPEPVNLSATEAYANAAQHEKFDGEFVKMTGRVVGYSDYAKTYSGMGTSSTLKLDVVEVVDADRRVRAMFPQGQNSRKKFEVGARIEFAGTCRLEPATPADRAGEIQILVPDISHAHLLELPPFWMRSAIQRSVRLAILGIASFIAFGALWALGQWRTSRALRRANAALEQRVAERTAELERALLQQTELARLKSDFVSLVSHEFRTPLGVIMSATEVLQRYFERLPSEKRERHLEMIFRSTKNLAALIEEVLLLSRVEEGRMHFTPVPLDLEKLCRAIADEVRSATEGVCPIQFHATTSLAGGVSDESILRHIVSNLLSNACKYSEPGTPVEFEAARAENSLVLTVRDHGIGIPPEDRSRLFSSFTRGGNVGPRPGSGLGLVVVKRCVDLHGGTVRLESEIGRGTTVTVVLPVFEGRSPTI